MRSRNAVGLVSLILAGAACSSAPEASKAGLVESTSAAQSKTPLAASTTTSGPLLDLGDTDPTDVVTVSIIFKVKQLDELEAYVQATEEPDSSLYHRFLSVGDFVQVFAPSQGDIARVSAYLPTFGITASAALADNLVLKATGTVAAFTQAFTFEMHDYKERSGTSTTGP